MIVVTRKIALRPSAIATFCLMLRMVLLRQRDHSGDVSDTAMERRGVRGIQSHVGATAHGDADVGGSERGSVIDAVADLRDLVAPRLKLGDEALLVCRKQFREDVDREAGCDRRRDAAVVAGQHDDPDAGISKGLEPGLRIRTRLVTHGDRASQDAVSHDEDGHGLAFVLKRRDLRHPVGRH